MLFAKGRFDTTTVCRHRQIIIFLILIYDDGLIKTIIEHRYIITRDRVRVVMRIRVIFRCA